MIYVLGKFEDDFDIKNEENVVLNKDLDDWKWVIDINLIGVMFLN